MPEGGSMWDFCCSKLSFFLIYLYSYFWVLKQEVQCFFFDVSGSVVNTIC